MEIDPYRDLKDRDLRREGLCIAEGRLLVERLLASGWEVLSILCAPRFAGRFEALAGERCPVLVRDQAEIASIAGFPFHRGVLAAASRPAPQGLETFLAQARPASTLVVCPQLTNEYNLGGILRSAACLGADGALIGSRCCDPLSRRALKAAMGAPFTMSLIQLREEEREIGLLKEAGYQVVGASPSPEALDLAPFRRSGKIAVVFGEEAEGLVEPWRSGCDALLAIPMREGTDSLNVAVAAGIFLYALRRAAQEAEV